jgi:hypothetical protein
MGLGKAFHDKRLKRVHSEQPVLGGAGPLVFEEGRVSASFLKGDRHHFGDFDAAKAESTCSPQTHALLRNDALVLQW